MKIGLFYFLMFLMFLVMPNNVKSQQLNVMTYNLRLDIASDGENAWQHRKDFLISQIMFLEPDILGVQEALPNQVKDLKEALKDYEFIGKGRDGGQEGEHSGIYYNSKKIKVAQAHTLWLSSTPEKFSKGWDAALPRVCTYGLFTLKESNQNIWVFNTHFDHVGEIARKESMKLILEKIESSNKSGFPVVFMGDLNVEPDSEVISLLKTKMKDSRDEAGIVFGPEGTFNAFNYNEPITRRIDYIMVSDLIWVQKYAVLSSTINLKYPSDHFPVFVQLKLE